MAAPMRRHQTAICLIAVVTCQLLRVSQAVESRLIISSRDVYRNYSSTPHTIEAPYNYPWQFACLWSRTNESDTASLTIFVPRQPVPLNCQFKARNAPAVCTPSNVEFTNSSSGQGVKSNVTCIEAGNTLTCSIEFGAFNPHHIGQWNCSARHGIGNEKIDSVLFQYYKPLSESNLVLASWDPIKQSNNTNGSATTNRFECFTSTAVIPPARLSFFLGGDELGMNNSKHPIDWMSETVFTAQPSMYTVNRTSPAPTQPASAATTTTELKLNQQFLASSRILHMSILPSYNGKILRCLAKQGLSDQHRLPSQDLVINLDDRNAAAVPISSMIFLLVAMVPKFTAVYMLS